MTTRPPAPRRCTAKTAAGKPCQAWAVRRSEPPRCAPHGGGKRPVGAPPGNKNAQTHGFYASEPDAVTIDDAIAGLADKMTRLDEIIAAHPQHDQFLVSIFAIYTQASSRLARLLRDRRALSGEAAEGLAAAFKQALAEAGPILGIDLT